MAGKQRDCIILKSGMKQFSLAFLALLCVMVLAAHAADRDDLKSRTGWPAYNGGFDSLHYSSLKQINRKNVAQLRVAWSYDTGDAFRGSEIECNPIVVNGVLYATTPKLRVVALDAATGKQKWSFDPHAGARVQVKMRNRGLTYWGGAAGEPARILVAVRQYLYAL